MGKGNTRRRESGKLNSLVLLEGLTQKNKCAPRFVCPPITRQRSKSEGAEPPAGVLKVKRGSTSTKVIGETEGPARGGNKRSGKPCNQREEEEAYEKGAGSQGSPETLSPPSSKPEAERP